MIELYINNCLCDVGRDFGVRLNRQLLNPGELNTKDAQYSYSITLPPTHNNHAIFNYANIEETANKFNREYRAELIINGVRVFTGLFRLSEITDALYKGNLYLPAAKTVKDIFGETELNQNAPYLLEFGDFAQSASKYNTDARTAVQPAIFPYVLYGILPKVNTTGEPSRDVWDAYVRITPMDMPPSLNVLSLLRHIFRGRGYRLEGSAFNDPRLTGLYMSYRNDPGYMPPWNFGRLGRISISGDWSNWTNKRTLDGKISPEEGVYENTGLDQEGQGGYLCNLFDATNSYISIDDDPGQNALYNQYAKEEGTYANLRITIPASGYYKVRLTAQMSLYRGLEFRRNSRTGVVTFEAGDQGPLFDGQSTLAFARHEVKVLRDWGRSDFGLVSGGVDGSFYRNNLSQNWDYDNPTGPIFMPKIDNGTQKVFIDKAQNKNYVVGLQWGVYNNDPDKFANKTDTGRIWAQVNAAKPAPSWDAEFNDDARTRLAIPSPGYLRYDGENWEPTEKYKIDVKNAPDVYAWRSAADQTGAGEGIGEVIVWLEAGEMLTVAHACDPSKGPAAAPGKFGWVATQVKYRLDITPYKVNEGWLKVDPSTGGSTDAIDWQEDTDFETDRIDLIKFLPSGIKTDDFIDNICKAFNLQLSQSTENLFTLDVKQTSSVVTPRCVDLDDVAAVKQRTNQPLGLPSLYRIGFTVDTEEEGYAIDRDDGGGEYRTGVTEEKIVEQKSFFSYGWFKPIQKDNVILPLPIISKHEPWDTEMPYDEAVTKRYTDQALRFWYYAGLLNDLGTTFRYGNRVLSVARVSNEMPGSSFLSYKNANFTILKNYFTIFINGATHYTEIEAYLTPIQYTALNGSALARFNGDLYYVAEISGYDPTGRNKTKIKLIRKI